MRDTEPFLDALRVEGDPEPDRIVAELVRDGQVEEVNAVLKHLIQNNQPIPESCPKTLSSACGSTPACRAGSTGSGSTGPPLSLRSTG